MRIILTNLASDITGYKLALVDERNPGATSTVATAVTTLVAGSHSVTAGGTTTAMTLTAGGSAAKWITKPLKSAITVPAASHALNFWAKRGSTAGHASCDFTLGKFTVSNQGAYFNVFKSSHQATGFAINPMISSTTAQRRLMNTGLNGSGTATVSSAFAAGDRIIVTGQVVNAFKASNSAVTTQSAGTLTLDFDGSLDGLDGDTWIDVPVGNATALQAQVTARQIIAGTIQTTIPLGTQGTVKGTQATALGLGRGFYQNLIDNIDAAVSTGQFTKDCSLQAFYNELIAERGDV